MSSRKKFRRLPIGLQRHLIRCFVEDLTASKTALILGINRKTVNDWYSAFRERLSLQSIAYKFPKPSKDKANFYRYLIERRRRIYGVPRSTMMLHQAESLARYRLSKARMAKLLAPCLVPK